MHIATYVKVVEEMLPKVRTLQSTLAAKANAFADTVKTGRTHLMDATPVTLGQEFSGYAMQLQRGMETIEDCLKHLTELALGGTARWHGPQHPRRLL